MRTRPPPLEDEQRRDQEARQDEEQVDPEEPARRPGDVVVIRDDRQHREGPQRIQRGVVGELGRTRYRRCVELGHAREYPALPSGNPDGYSFRGLSDTSIRIHGRA